MQVEHGSLRAEAVLPGGGHTVDPHGFVDVFDSVLNGAHVGVGHSVAVSKVQRDARPRPVALHRTNILRESAGPLIANAFTQVSTNLLCHTSLKQKTSGKKVRNGQKSYVLIIAYFRCKGAPKGVCSLKSWILVNCLLYLM